MRACVHERRIGMRHMRNHEMLIRLLIPALLTAALLRPLAAEPLAARIALSDPGTYCYDDTDVLSETAPYVAASCPAPLENVDAPRAGDTAETRAMKRMTAQEDADQEVQVGASWQDPDADVSPAVSGQEVDDVAEDVSVPDAPPPRSPDRSKRVVLIHGLDMRGPDFKDTCEKSW